MINFHEKEYSVLTYNEKNHDKKEIKLIWKKSHSEEKNDKIFDWVMDLLLDRNVESYFRKVKTDIKHGSDFIKCFEEKIATRALERGLEKLAVLLPQNIYNQHLQEILFAQGRGRVEYFHCEDYAKSWVENKEKNRRYYDK